MLLQIGPLLRLGSKCYYGWDFYYAWVQMLLQIGPLLHLGPVITLVPFTDVRLLFPSPHRNFLSSLKLKNFNFLENAGFLCEQKENLKKYHC